MTQKQKEQQEQQSRDGQDGRNGMLSVTKDIRSRSKMPPTHLGSFIFPTRDNTHTAMACFAIIHLASARDCTTALS